MEDSRETPKGTTDAELSTCVDFTSSSALDEVWIVLFSFMKNSSHCCVDVFMAAKISMDSLGFLLKRLPPLKESANFLILAVIPQYKLSRRDLMS